MNLLDSGNLRKILRFAGDPEGQTDGDRLTLTVMDILQIVGEGRVDFDPARCEEARRVKRPLRKSSGAEQGYWDLVQGVYWATCNESVQVPEGSLLILQPHPALMRNGLWHPTLFISRWEDLSGILLVVGARAVRLMERAPLSTALVVSRSD